MAIEKCFALYLPLRTKRLCTMGNAKKLSLFSGVIIFAFNASAFFIYGTETASDGKKHCVFVNVPDGYQFIHSQIDAFLYSFIPLTVITARVRTYDGRLCFHRCVSVRGGGVRSLSKGKIF